MTAFRCIVNDIGDAMAIVRRGDLALWLTGPGGSQILELFQARG